MALLSTPPACLDEPAATPGDIAGGADTTDTSEVVPLSCPEAPCEPGEMCDAGACVCDPTPVSFAADLAPRFATGCGPGCHVFGTSPASGSSGLNLAAAFAHAELVGVPAFECAASGSERIRVVPGDIAASYLMDKLLGRDMCKGVRMPKGRSPWSAEDLAMVGRWICQGASPD